MGYYLLSTMLGVKKIHILTLSILLTQAKKIEEAAEGWEYAPLFNLKFHATERTMDLVRRRRWHRKMVCEKKGADCFFAMKFEVFIFYSSLFNLSCLK